MAYNYPTIKFITGSEDIVKILYDLGVRKENIFILKTRKWYDLGMCKVKLDELSHDVDNYALHIEKSGHKAIYIVDTNNVDNIVAKDYDLYLIEANYKQTILDEHLQNCTDEEKVYLLRVPNTHLSWEQANDFLINNMGSNSEYQFIHESSYNYKEEE